MSILVHYNFLRLGCLFLPEMLSWEIDTGKGSHRAEKLLEINAPPDDFMKDIAESDELIKDEENANYRLNLLHQFRGSKRSLNPAMKYPLNVDLNLSERSFDLEYEIDEMSSHVGMNALRPQQMEHLRVERDVNATKDEEEELEYPYDYESFHREYFDYIWEKKNESMMEPSRFYRKLAHLSPLQDFKVCLPDDWQTGVGAMALYCTVQRGSTKGFTKAEFSRLGQILKFWAVVYLVAGGAMWIICGWCCCCLRCTACNPDKIREEVPDNRIMESR